MSDRPDRDAWSLPLTVAQWTDDRHFTDPHQSLGQHYLRADASALQAFTWYGPTRIIGPGGDWARHPTEGTYRVVRLTRALLAEHPVIVDEDARIIMVLE